MNHPQSRSKMNVLEDRTDPLSHFRGTSMPWSSEPLGRRLPGSRVRGPRLETAILLIHQQITISPEATGVKIVRMVQTPPDDLDIGKECFRHNSATEVSPTCFHCRGTCGHIKVGRYSSWKTRKWGSGQVVRLPG